MTILQKLPQDFPWLDRIHCYGSVDSTNLRAKAMAAQGAPDGTTLLAFHQSAGRGRMGRSFHSPEGKGVYLSVILRPNCKADMLMHLTCSVGVAMCNTVENVAGIRPGIKWINDLVLNNRKIGGILTEMALKPDGTVDYAVVGVGINCTQAETDFPEEIRHIAASVSQFSREIVLPDVLGAKMIMEMEKLSHSLFQQKNWYMQQYRRDCITLGKEIIIHRSNENQPALACDVDNDGGLIVRYHNGRHAVVQSGEVSVRGLYSYV